MLIELKPALGASNDGNNPERENMPALRKENGVNNFSTVENSHLKARIKRLKHEEQDLLDRVTRRVLAVAREDRWLKSDPLYQSLSSVLANVRLDLKNAEKALSR